MLQCRNATACMEHRLAMTEVWLRTIINILPDDNAAPPDQAVPREKLTAPTDGCCEIFSPAPIADEGGF